MESEIMGAAETFNAATVPHTILWSRITKDLQELQKNYKILTTIYETKQHSLGTWPIGSSNNWVWSINCETDFQKSLMLPVFDLELQLEIKSFASHHPDLFQISS